MPTRPTESTHEAEPDHPLHDGNAAGVESPSRDQLQGASSLPHENADDAELTDQDIDIAGTEADEQSVRHSSRGLPASDGGSPTKSL
jgi:hypothetical protein